MWSREPGAKFAVFSTCEFTFFARSSRGRRDSRLFAASVQYGVTCTNVHGGSQVCAPAALIRMRSLVRFQLAPLGSPAHTFCGRLGRSRTLPAVKMFRRVLLVLGVAGAIGAIARVRAKTEVVATEGGWRELDGPDFR